MRQKFVEYFDMCKLQVSHIHIIKIASVKEGCFYKMKILKELPGSIKCLNAMQDEL